MISTLSESQLCFLSASSVIANEVTQEVRYSLPHSAVSSQRLMSGLLRAAEWLWKEDKCFFNSRGKHSHSPQRRRLPITAKAFELIAHSHLHTQSDKSIPAACLNHGSSVKLHTPPPVHPTRCQITKTSFSNLKQMFPVRLKFLLPEAHVKDKRPGRTTAAAPQQKLLKESRVRTWRAEDKLLLQF